MADELWRKGALELAELISTGKGSSVEVVDAHLARMDEVNPHLNAVVRRMDDEARAAAEAADRAVAAGDALGPMHGVPFTVKENIDVAGTPTTSGVPMLADAIAGTDAPSVGRMRAAGAIPIGRTNLPDLGLRVTTESSLHGVTRNPWNPTRTSGGSSGGEASAIASGMSPLGFGNDLGGSLRTPAHCCGITSIKPSTGVVPMATVIPPEDLLLSYQLMAVEGVMARRVADVRAGLVLVAGPDVRDPLALPVTLTDRAEGRALRVAVLADPPGGATDAGIAAAIRSAGDVFSDAGAEVVEASPESYTRAVELWRLILLEDIRAQVPMLQMVLGEAGAAFLGFAMHDAPPLDTATFAALFVERLAVEKNWLRFLTEYDVLLTPTWAQPTFELGADAVSHESTAATLELIRPVLPANLLGLPAAIVPVGIVDGMPVGAQLTGRRFADLTCLAAAEVLENALGPLTPIDPVM